VDPLYMLLYFVECLKYILEISWNYGESVSTCYWYSHGGSGAQNINFWIQWPSWEKNKVLLAKFYLQMKFPLKKLSKLSAVKFIWTCVGYCGCAKYRV
jgi:hypothetical protein